MQRLQVAGLPAEHPLGGPLGSGNGGEEPTTLPAAWREGKLVAVTPFGAVGQARREYRLSADGARLDLVTTFTFDAAGDSLVLSLVYARQQSATAAGRRSYCKRL